MALSVLRDIRKIYAGLNADEIRGAAYRDLNIGLMAASDEAHLEMEQFFAPAWLDPLERAEALKAIHRVDGPPRNHFDFVVCGAGVPVPPNGYFFNPVDTEYMARTIVAAHQDME